MTTARSQSSLPRLPSSKEETMNSYDVANAKLDKLAHTHFDDAAWRNVPEEVREGKWGNKSLDQCTIASSCRRAE
jgi:hypothetical protein